MTVYSRLTPPPLVACGAFASYQDCVLWFLCLYEALTDDDAGVGWYLCQSCFSLLGLAMSPFFWTLGLFEIVRRSATLQSVVLAVTQSSGQLIMSSLLGVFTVHTFSAFGFFFMPTRLGGLDERDDCTTLGECFSSVFYHGVIRGNPILQTSFDDDAYARESFFSVELLFYILIATLLVNMIFGVIIDRFGALRDAEVENNAARDGRCFICGIEKQRFDAAKARICATYFKEVHRAHEHNMWNYVYYIVYLRDKHTTDFSGLDSYVDGCLKSQDTSWCPTNRAMCLESEAAADA